MSMHLVWKDNKFLSYMGWLMVLVTIEVVNLLGLTVLRVWLVVVMMIRSYRYWVYRGLVNVIDKGGGEHDGGWRSWRGLFMMGLSSGSVMMGVCLIQGSGWEMVFA